jgi:hypothetical protein
MTDTTRLVEDQSARAVADLEGHPRGTLAIVVIFGLLFVLSWVAVYVMVFLERGAPHS